MNDPNAELSMLLVEHQGRQTAEKWYLVGVSGVVGGYVAGSVVAAAAGGGDGDILVSEKTN